MLKEVLGLLESARAIMSAEATIVTRLNGEGSVWTEQIIQMDNQVYALISRVIELLEEYEEIEPS